MTTHYCEARHPKSPNGCYELDGHKYQHRGYPEGYGAAAFYWEDETAPAPAEPKGLVLTNEELAVLAVLCLQVDKFYPELGPKILAAKESIQ